jgi:hypothetical protein
MKEIDKTIKELELEYSKYHFDDSMFFTFLESRLATKTMKKIKKYTGKNITYKKLANIFNKYQCCSLDNFLDEQYEQKMEDEEREIFSYDLTSLDGFIPGFTYEIVGPNKIKILGTFIDS